MVSNSFKTEETFNEHLRKRSPYSFFSSKCGLISDPNERIEFLTCPRVTSFTCPSIETWTYKLSQMYI